jgi:catechol-2,3-dioxygenase
MDITLSPYFKKIEHIGVAVKNIESSNQLYEMLLGVKSYKQVKMF